MKLQIVISLLALSGLALAQDSAWNPSPSPSPEIPFPTPTPKEEVFDQKIVDTAMSQIGLVKQVGYDAPIVKMYVETTDQEADEYYSDGWCNAFVSWVLKQNGYEYASLNSVDQIGYFFHQVSIPKIGDVVTLSGHIAFYGGKADFPGLNGIAIKLLGGNQGHAVNVLPIKESEVVAYWEPIKAPTGWTPSRHLSSSSMAGYNRIDDRSYVADQLNQEAMVH